MTRVRHRGFEMIGAEMRNDSPYTDERYERDTTFITGKSKGRMEGNKRVLDIGDDLRDDGQSRREGR